MTVPAAFAQRVGATFDREPGASHPTQFAKSENVYTEGDPADRVYLMDSGRVKLVTLSPAGKECLLAIHVAGSIFGELCVAGPGMPRCETATAMEPTIVRSLPAATFMGAIAEDTLREGFVQHLMRRISHQQRIITSLVTVDSERRLAETLLFLAESLGRPDPHSRRIVPGLSHEELAQMIGTTRPRVTAFMTKFRALGLVRSTYERHLIVSVEKLTAHLAQARLRGECRLTSTTQAV